MPPRAPKKPACRACNDTLVNSRGNPCRSCELNGRIKSASPPPPPSPKKEASLWD